jgi:hypothetical protein
MAAPDNVEFGGASSGIVYVEGVVPAGERDISAPIKIGSRAATNPPNPVEPGDVVDAYLDLQGRQVVYHDRPLPEGDNEIGAVNVSKVAGNVTATGAGDTTSGTLRVVVAADDANIASIQMATEDMVGLIASTLIGDATGSLVKTNLRDADGNEIGTAAKPIHVDIRGEIPDAMDLDRVGGSATDVGSGNAGSGTLRVAVATDDVNIAAIKTASEASSDALDDIKAAVEGTLDTSLQTAIPAGTNEIGAVNVSKVAGNVTATGAGDTTSGTLRVAIADDDTNLTAIKVAVEKIDDVQAAIAAEGAVPTKGMQMLLDDGADGQFVQGDTSGNLKTTLQTALPAGTNEIGGVNQTKVAGTAVSVNSGVLDAGTQRVAIATDDVNLSAIKTAAEKIDDIQDVIVAEGGVATKGVQICLDDGVDTQFAQCDASGNLSVNLQTALPAGTNEIGGVNVVKVAGAAPSTAGKLDVLVADGDNVALGATTDVAVAAGAEGTLSAKLRLVTSQIADAVTALQAIDDWDSGDQCKVTPTAMGYVEANGNGTTADAYAAAATIDMRAYNQLKLLLKNTDAANGLTCQVTCYAKYGGVISVDVSGETALAPGAVGEVMISEKWAQVVVKVKSTVVDTPATYAYEYIQSVM